MVLHTPIWIYKFHNRFTNRAKRFLNKKKEEKKKNAMIY